MTDRRLKVVTICAAGVVRSGAMAFMLKWNKIDAIALSGEYISPEAFAEMSAWADRIVLMVPEYAPLIPAQFHSKIRMCDFGPDVWGNPNHPELLGKCMEWLNAGKLNP